MLVGCAASRHIPAPCNGLKKSTRPAGIPRTTSELNPSSGIKRPSGNSSDSSRQTYFGKKFNEIWLIIAF